MAKLQRKLPELGRIRLGELKTNAKGKTFPSRIDHFRFTSPNPVWLQQMVALGWGDEVREWENAPDGRQWELYSGLESLSCYVPPESALTQYHEIWGSECCYRCDGETVLKVWTHKDYPELGTDIIEGMPCQCDKFPNYHDHNSSHGPDHVTRLSLFLADLTGIGLWRVETKGYYAGTELPGIVEFLEAQSQSGNFIECDLCIVMHKIRRYGQTRVFSSLSLQLREGMTMRELLAPRPQTRALSDSASTTHALPMPSDEDVYGAPLQTVQASASADHVVENVASGDLPSRGDILNRLCTLRKEHGIKLADFNSWITQEYKISNAKGPSDLSDENLYMLCEHLRVYGHKYADARSDYTDDTEAELPF